ncbi:MAG TPA: O-antigen ligase family protein [Aquihabitans sp.]|nr:O-antigen ligase family protein [Aquihabitans sp.]
MCAGLFLCSSDRFLAADLGGLTLKPSYVLLGAAAALGAAREVVRPGLPLRSAVPGLLPVLAALVAVYLVASTTATSKLLAVTQLVVIVGGALLPFLAIGLGLRHRVDVDRGLTALFAGTLTAATFGFYQFAAATLGLPIPGGLAYAGAVDGVGRISAWSYEPAFYVFHLELTLALAVGDVLAGRRRFGVRPEVPAAYLLLSLVLANARIGFLSFPILLLLVLRASSDRRRLDPRAMRVVRLGAGAIVAAVLVGLPFGVNLPSYVAARVASVADTQEAESNAVRVDLYGTELDLAKDRPLLGYGPGNIGLELVELIPAYAGAPPQTAPANNLLLQAVLDAGVASLLLTVAFVAVVVRSALRNRSRDARLLFAGAAAILLVNAMTASLFWDLRLWAVLGLAYAAARTTALERPVRPSPRPS